MANETNVRRDAAPGGAPSAPVDEHAAAAASLTIITFVLAGIEAVAAIISLCWSSVPRPVTTVPQFVCAALLVACVLLIRRETRLSRAVSERRLVSGAQLRMRSTEGQLLISEELSEQVIETLADAIDAKDEFASGHSYRVAEYSRLMGEALGLPPAEVGELRREALLHDIGKIAVPEAVLTNAGKLSQQETLVLRSHTVIGADILGKLTSLPGAAAVARFHHERSDGTGYPAGLLGRDIPVHARIVAIADAFDAMHSDRIYRKGLPLDVIRAELIKGRGTQFDSRFLDVFLSLLDRGALDPIRNISSRMRLEGTQAKFHAELQKAIDREGNAIRRSGVPLTEHCDAIASVKSVQSSLALKYSQRFDIIAVTLLPKQNAGVTREQHERAIAAMGFAAKKSLEGIGVFSYCSPTQLLVLLYDTSVNTVDMLLQRIYLDFFRVSDSERFDLTYFEI